MRAALAMFVAVVQVAGPWLCCCGSAHAFAAVTAPVNLELAPATETPSGCPICAKLAAELGQREAVAPAVPTKPSPHSPTLPERCPCGGVTIEVAPPATLDTGANVLVAFVVELGFAPPTIPDFTPIAIEPRPVGVSDLPFLPPGDRTRVHHVLHC